MHHVRTVRGLGAGRELDVAEAPQKGADGDPRFRAGEVGADAAPEREVVLLVVLEHRGEVVVPGDDVEAFGHLVLLLLWSARTIREDACAELSRVPDAVIFDLDG